MVLVKEEDSSEENLIYYLSHGLIGMKINYSHVDKLALETIHAI
jgi:hypothetical protein